MSPVVPGGKRTRADRADDMSPMSDPEGGTPSMNDPGYGSLSYNPSSLEQPNSLPKDRARSGSGGSLTGVSDQVPLALKPAGMSVL